MWPEPHAGLFEREQLTINIAVMAFLLVYIKRSRSLTARLYVIINELELFN